MTALKAEAAYFIRLGSRGEWAEEYLRDGTLLIDFCETPLELLSNRDWEGVKKFWSDESDEFEKKKPNVRRGAFQMGQIKRFYEADETSIFITFHGGLMYWCRPCGPIVHDDDHSKTRSLRLTAGAALQSEVCL